MEDWSREDDAERLRLLNICKEHSGEYLPGHHGSGSWATTYSSAFIDASAALWKLHKKNGSYFPQHAMALDFQKQGIRSCRGATMWADRVEYLFNTHLKNRI